MRPVSILPSSSGIWAKTTVVALLALTLQFQGASSSLHRNPRKETANWMSKGLHYSTPRHNKDPHNSRTYAAMHNSVHGAKRSQRHFDKMSPEEQVRCHQTALWKCGSVFMDMFGMLRNLSEEDAFEPRCALRSTFYSCLKSQKSKPCKRHHKVHEKFKKRLADTLWETRNCLPGLH